MTSDNDFNITAHFGWTNIKYLLYLEYLGDKVLENNPKYFSFCMLLSVILYYFPVIFLVFFCDFLIKLLEVSFKKYTKL